MKLNAKIEALLFVASRPLSVKKLTELTAATVEDVRSALDQLRQEYNTSDRGLQLATLGTSVQIVTSPLNAKLVADFLKAERSGELTKPSLEALTIIAYRGPIAKSEIDLIRGVNCSLILRNLMIRGLITAQEDKDKMATLYEIAFDFLRHLGVTEVSELPDYPTLNADTRLDDYLRPKPSADVAGGNATSDSAVDSAPDVSVEVESSGEVSHE